MDKETKYENLPEVLKEDAGFLLWRYENVKGRKTKVPYSIKGIRTDATRRDSYSTYSSVISTYAEGGYDGIGIFIDRTFSAVDIDGCILDGKLSDLAEDIIGRLDSYTEVSPSGKGIRIVIDTSAVEFEKSRYYVNNRRIGVEVYTEKKFVSVTGNVIKDNPIRTCGAEFIAFMDEYMMKPVSQGPKVETPGSCLSDDAVLDIASGAANGEKFRRLWEGDISGYPSHSEAELALCSMLAFYCGGDLEQIDRIYRRSGMCGEKWNRDDYRANTLVKAVSGLREYYRPMRTSAVEEDFGVPEFIDSPIPLDDRNVPPFPMEALPKDIRDYVAAVAESTQTPVDVAACASLSILSIGTQGKYVVKPKVDWKEPLNTYIAVFMPPSERKSAVCSAMSRPMNEYEAEWNARHKGEIDFSRSERSILERKLKSLEDLASKGKAEMDDVRRASDALSGFRGRKPLRFYCDDVTTEKLVSMLAENDGKAAIFSPEGGIFDLLKGMYTRYVNIDVFLKGYSGDPISVDRIGRESETIRNPVLTMMLMAQPKVLEDVMGNSNFRGRGFTARFLYCIPDSNVGGRRYHSVPIPPDVYREYERCIRGILEEEPGVEPKVITVSEEADALIAAFSEELEPKLLTEFADMADWAGKIVGNTARIAALLCRAESRVAEEFLEEPEPLVISAEVMERAISIGRYFICHARAAFSLLGLDEGIRNCKYVLAAIRNAGLLEVNRRDIMRLCRSLKTKDAVQTVIDQLVDYGYLAERHDPRQAGRGRTPLTVYAVNPCIWDGKGI